MHKEFWWGNQRERDRLEERERLWWEDDIKIDQEIELGLGLDLARDRDS
jgi:hypothetical protein